jgi:Flp pilus assembly protein TadB
MTPTAWACLLALSVGWTARPRPPMRRPGPRGDAAPRPDHSGRRSIHVSRVARSPRATARRRRSDGAVELARWCETLARAVRGGDTLRIALERVEPPVDHAEALVGLGRAGSRTGRSVAGDPDVAIVLAVVTACLEHGGPAAEPLDRAAGVLRSRAAERAERRVQSAQARLSATVLTWLPIAVLGVMVVTSPAVRRVVVSPVGATVVTIGAIINVLGWWWMRRIVERAAR